MSRLHAALVPMALIGMSLALAACESERLNVPETAADDPARVELMEPRRSENQVRLDAPIFVIFDRELLDGEFDAAHASVGGEPAGITLSPSGRSIDVEPASPLEYHRVYDITLSFDAPYDYMPQLAWQFATRPGPAGEIWERADANTTNDLLFVQGWNSGHVTAGRGGELYASPPRFEWGTPFGVGTGGTAQSDDVVWLWPGNNGYGAALTAEGDVYVGSLGRYMQHWTPDADLHILGIWSVTDVMVGSLRSDPTMGFIATEFPDTTTLTGTGRVMRAATQGWNSTLGNYYLAVGDNGSVFFSFDRVAWTDISYAPAWGDLRAVIPGYSGVSPESQVPPVGVAVGDAIAWAPDPYDWRLATVPPAPLHGLSWSGYPTGEWFAVGENATILHSTDGKLWQSVDTGLDLGGVDLFAVSAGYARWVIVGESGTTLITPPVAIDL